MSLGTINNQVKNMYNINTKPDTLQVLNYCRHKKIWNFRNVTLFHIDKGLSFTVQRSAVQFFYFLFI